MTLTWNSLSSVQPPDTKRVLLTIENTETKEREVVIGWCSSGRWFDEDMRSLEPYLQAISWAELPEPDWSDCDQ